LVLKKQQRPEYKGKTYYLRRNSAANVFPKYDFSHRQKSSLLVYYI
jgi:hypothetical protein